LDFTKPHHVETRVVGRQLTIIAKPIVSAVHQRILYNNGAEIHIVTTGPVDRNYRISSSDNTLSIELPSTHLKPKTVESESHYYGAISITNTHIDIPLRSKTPLIFPEFGNQLTVRFQPEPDREIVGKITMPSPPLAPVNTKHEPLKQRIIAIDPGHGGSDPGAVGLYGMHEKDYNRDISDHLMRLLRQSGARVVNLRLSDRNPSLSSRSSEANANAADITVSVHVNSFYKEHANGTETYFYKWKDRRLATALQSAMTRELKLKDNGVKRAKMYILNHTTMPAALVEPAFMTNRDDAKKLKNPEFRARIAQSIHDGIVTYFESNP
jgi:N-acetylmuramoyl-L-alanine amidase